LPRGPLIGVDFLESGEAIARTKNAAAIFGAMPIQNVDRVRGKFRDSCFERWGHVGRFLLKPSPIKYGTRRASSFLKFAKPRFYDDHHRLDPAASDFGHSRLRDIHLGRRAFNCVFAA
jgi:hypothetical protein